MQRALLILLVLFVIDLFVPQGVAAGVLYILGVIATLSCQRRRETFIVAGVATVFIMAAEMFSPDRGGTEIWKVIANRVLTVAAIWGTAIAIYLRGKAMDQLAVVSRQLNRELDYASRLQHRLYPKQSPRIEGVDVSGTVMPAEQLCGDYYDYLEMPGPTYGFVIGDVSGHGIGQSLIMSDVRSTLRSLADTGQNLGQILQGVNLKLLEDTPDDIFVTLMIVQLDPQSMTFTYATAGHSGLLIRASGECEELRSETLALGLSRDASYATQPKREFHVGDTLLLTTDGLEERHSPESELFGRERMIREVRSSGSCSSEQLIGRLVAAATRFARGLKPHDDVTLIVVRRPETSSPAHTPHHETHEATKRVKAT